MAHPTSIALAEAYRESGISAERFDEVIQSMVKQGCKDSLQPDKIQARINGVVAAFAEDGLTLKQYLKAALRRPSLFYQDAKTIEKNIREVVRLFAVDGLTVEGYLKAALDQPQLFTQAPHTIQSNIRGTVRLFEPEGLTVRDYLKAAVEKASCFYLKPRVIQKNIRAIAKRFAKDGLTVDMYLKAALRRPSLFYQSPKTISGHIRLLLAMGDGEIMRFGKKNTRPEFWQSVLTRSDLLCLTLDNYLLRGAYACQTGKKKKAFYKPFGFIAQELLSDDSTYAELLDRNFVGPRRPVEDFLGSQPYLKWRMRRVLRMCREMKTGSSPRTEKKTMVPQRDPVALSTTTGSARAEESPVEAVLV